MPDHRTNNSQYMHSRYQQLPAPPKASSHKSTASPPHTAQIPKAENMPTLGVVCRKSTHRTAVFIYCRRDADWGAS